MASCNGDANELGTGQEEKNGNIISLLGLIVAYVVQYGLEIIMTTLSCGLAIYIIGNLLLIIYNNINNKEFTIYVHVLHCIVSNN